MARELLSALPLDRAILRMEHYVDLYPATTPALVTAVVGSLEESLDDTHSTSSRKKLGAFGTLGTALTFLIACGGQNPATAPATPFATPTKAPTPIVTMAPTPSASPSLEVSPTPTLVVTPSPSLEVSPTPTPDGEITSGTQFGQRYEEWKHTNPEILTPDQLLEATQQFFVTHPLEGYTPDIIRNLHNYIVKSNSSNEELGSGCGVSIASLLSYTRAAGANDLALQYMGMCETTANKRGQKWNVENNPEVDLYYNILQKIDNVINPN